MTRPTRLFLIALSFGGLLAASATFADASPTIVVSGTINARYHGVIKDVYLEPAPPTSRRSSRFFRGAKRGKLKIVVDAKDFPPGAYYVHNCAGPSTSGCGGLRITLAGRSKEIGILGDCDL